jgi:hypothetical protein
MDKRVYIKYLAVSNSQTKVQISLVPWFILPGRPFPIFAYVYAVWHYDSSEQKSMQQSAEATEELFGIDGFSKSTISRTIKVMEQLISNFQMDSPLPTTEPEILSAAPAIGCISELLKNCQSIESLKNALWAKSACLPPTIRNSNNISYALSLIPNELSMVIKDSGASPEKARDGRKRKPRQRVRKTEPVKRCLDFVEFRKREEIRRTFIALCKAYVLNAAVLFHHFLI